MSRRDRQTEAARRYREMVRAVRAWVRLAHPRADKLTILHESDAGTGETIAAFHAGGTEWSRGDMMATKGRS